MITAERKPFDELYECARRHEKVLVLGCGSCVTVCMAGGDAEVETLATQIRLAARERDDNIDVATHTIVRQCDREFFDDETSRLIDGADAVISMGCGVGAQCCSEYFPEKVIYPALNTELTG